MMTKMDETCFWLSYPLEESDSPSEHFIASHNYSDSGISNESNKPLPEQTPTPHPPKRSILGLDELAQLDNELAISQYPSMMDDFLELVDSAAAVDIPPKESRRSSVKASEPKPLPDILVLDNPPELNELNLDLEFDTDMPELIPLADLDIERVIDGLVSETLPQLEQRLRMRLRLLIQSA